MLIKEGAVVGFGIDNKDLLRGLSANKAAMAGFALAAGTAIAGVAAASAKMAAQLDRDIRLVATLTGATTREMQTMSREVRQLGREFGKNLNEIARANYQAVSGGFKSITDAQKIMRAGTRLSISGNADLVQSTEAVVKALNAFGGSADDAEKAAAQLWGITQDGIITVEQLGRFLQDIPATAAASGLAFYELAAGLSTITAQTGHASGAMDMMRAALIKLETAGFTGTLIQRVESLAGKSLPELTKILGDQVAARGVLMLANNMDKLRENVASAERKVGDFNVAVDIMTDGSTAKWERLSAAVKDFGIELGNAVTQNDGPVEKLTNALNALNNMGQKFGWEMVLKNPAAALAMAASVGWDSEYTGPLGPVTWESTVPEYKGPLRPSGMPAYPGGYAGPDVSIQAPYNFDPYDFNRSSWLEDKLFGRGGGGYNPLFGSLAGLGSAFESSGVGVAAGFGPGMAPHVGPSSDAAAEFERLSKATDQAAKGAGQMTTGAQMAAAGVMTLSSSMSGMLVGALIQTDSAVGRLVAGLLQTVMQIGTQSLISHFFPSKASGGFTGSSMGVYHPNEFVFSADAVKAIGLGNLQAMHAGATNTANLTINQTITGGDPRDISTVTTGAVMTGLREAKLMGADRQFRTSTERWSG